MPTFAFPPAPAPLAGRLHRRGNAPLPRPARAAQGFGGALDARSLSMRGRSTSELLRTL